MRRRALALLIALAAFAPLHAAEHATEKSGPPKASPDRVEIRLLDADGKVVAQRANTPEQPVAELRVRRIYEKGDRIRIQGPAHLRVALGDAMPEALVFCLDGVFEFALPFDQAALAYSPFKAEGHHITASAATKADLAQYRNLALNPYASLDKPASFPHASANSVCRGEPVFAARNAIDGLAQPKGHGSWPHQSWGPDQKDGLSWRLDFGREVEIDKLVVILRADLPHDKFFTAATLVASDNSRTELKLQPNGGRQEFPFPTRKVSWIELRDWALPKPSGWCAVTAIEAWGRDASDYQKKATWRETLLAQLASGPSTAIARAIQDFPEDRQQLEVVADWALQDKLEGPSGLRPDAVRSVLDSLGQAGADLLRQWDELEKAQAPASVPRSASPTVPGLSPTAPSDGTVGQANRGTHERLAELYLAACERRRAARLAPHRDTLRRIVFTRHYDLGGSHYAYTEGQSDAQAERHFTPGSALCLLELDFSSPSRRGGSESRPPRRGGSDSSSSPPRRGGFAFRPGGADHNGLRTLIDDPRGVIRDPDVSYDGTRILFAWKRSLNEDDYHLYELNLLDGTLRQLTFGLGFADYEPAYLPNGDLLFNSTRCVQSVDCWWTEVSNLYTCDRDGRFLRRLGYDQVHTNFPTVTHDGRVIYTRWDYSDRGQIFPQGLFEMHPDGTGQIALYGNNTWFPTAILHARSIPGSRKFISVFSGHHTMQKGWLGLLDPGRGRQENAGAQLVAPVRETKAVRTDAYGQTGDQFQYPYPLNEREYLVTFRPAESGGATAGSSSRAPGTGGDPARSGKPTVAQRFGIYYMDADGHRELLVSDPRISCNQPIPLAPRPVPHVRPSTVDYRQDTGIVTLQDIYRGPGLAGVPRGTIRNLRVVALDFRAAAIGSNGNAGPAGGAMASTPISIQGAWDPKRILGLARVYPDGSACFVVPARTPIYFQALDAKGYAVQTMRSWATLQPGERVSCVGCHDNKNATPPVAAPTQALQAGPQPLAPWVPRPSSDLGVRRGESTLKQELERGTHGTAVGFSFIREVQPILDQHCIRCHFLPPASQTAAIRSPAYPPPNPEPRSPNPEPPAPRASSASLPPDPDNRKPTTDNPPSPIRPAFSLKGTQTLDPGAGRKWSDAYKALADRRFCNWINIQSEPTLLPPYHAGAARSRLIALLEAGHYGLRLAPDELARIATWIDLLVPYCGDYTEAMHEPNIPRYMHFVNKRKRMEALEALNIADLLASQRPGR